MKNYSWKKLGLQISIHTCRSKKQQQKNKLHPKTHLFSGRAPFSETNTTQIEIFQKLSYIDLYCLYSCPLNSSGL